MAIQVVRVVGGLCLHDILAYLPDTFISEIPRMESYRIRYQGAKGGALRDFHTLLFWLLLFPEFRPRSPCDRRKRSRCDGGTSVVRLDKRMVEDFHAYGSHRRSGRRLGSLLV